MSCVKMQNTSQAYIYKYQNLKTKLHNCNANICFNQKQLHNILTPKFAKIKIPNTSPASKCPQLQATTVKTDG
jgi:hypothetical protein